MNRCKYCLTEYNQTECHNTRLCYEYSYFIVCEKIDTLKDILLDLYNLEETLRLYPEPITEELNIQIIYES
jgi:hypothetical protein